MYIYDQFDREFLAQRTAEFRDQVERRLSGQLTEDEFKVLRLMNGVYLQLHAYMLRICIPYGTLSSPQLRMLAHVARTYDRNYGHFTTRQNIQYNWIALKDLPAAMADLASVGIHGIQTSGNCIRNTTTDHRAGAVVGEIDDPRVWAEIIRQWSTNHPEFTYLPRKFKIAVSAAEEDRAAVLLHDIGLRLLSDANGKPVFKVMVGGGLGRTPFVGKIIREDLAPEHLLSYLEAILRVYNAEGRRDNIYKARIKILVHEVGAEEFARRVEAEWDAIRDGYLHLDDAAIADIRSRFRYPEFEALQDAPSELVAALMNPAFARWHENSVGHHKVPGHAIVTLSLKPVGGPPGDATAEQMEAIADLADRYGFGEIRVAHEQNLCLPHVRQKDLPALWRALDAIGVATPNVNFITDIIACPGLDYCALANARSIPLAEALTERFADLDRAKSIGRLHVNISGCINACGHHHIGHIGILGVEKNGQEFYQLTLGGKADENATLGQLLGPAVPYDGVIDVIERVVDTYLDLRESQQEVFVDAVKRLGVTPFKERAYVAG
jgi:sulfite reductase (NADPH) hemoprotein beta-component